MKAYRRNCPNCCRVITYNHSSHYHCALRINSTCKHCSSQRNAEKRNKLETEKWSCVFGIVPKRPRIFNKWKQIWNSFDETKKQYILNKTKLQKIYYWGHINRARKVEWKKALKKSFVKYRGDNHWIHRPEVYAKTIETCKKYCGDNHWFRNPNYVKKS